MDSGDALNACNDMHTLRVMYIITGDHACIWLVDQHDADGRHIDTDAEAMLGS